MRSLVIYAIWVLVLALVAGGKPWHFPQNGNLWMANPEADFKTK
jgi:hypothetical protein